MTVQRLTLQTDWGEVIELTVPDADDEFDYIRIHESAAGVELLLTAKEAAWLLSQGLPWALTEMLKR